MQNEFDHKTPWPIKHVRCTHIAFGVAHVKSLQNFEIESNIHEPVEVFNVCFTWLILIKIYLNSLLFSSIQHESFTFTLFYFQQLKRRLLLDVYGIVGKYGR